MNDREKEVIQAQLNHEKAVLESLKKQYTTALNDINRKIRILQSDDMTQSKVYQLQYQQALKGQVEGILEKMHGDNFSTIQQYLSESYTNAYVGTMYDIAGQGIPVIMPIDQKAAVKAVQLDSKISKGLYNAIGVDTAALKKTITSEITRGIAANMSYADIARNINKASQAGYSNASRIVRTEGHRIQQASADDARTAAKSKGADVVKQWDSTLDGVTRDTHRQLDGQIREIDEPFEVDGMTAMYPGDFGDPAEDCNCRCVALTRAKWGLDESELQTLQDRAEYFGLDKAKNFDDFKKNYLEAADKIFSPINTRNSENGKASGIVLLGTDLNTRQKNILERLPEYDSMVTVSKSAVSMYDLSALTAKTGDEFALFTRGSQRTVVRGNTTSVNIDIDKAKELAQNGYKWSGHTHPGYDLNALTASEGDYNILEAFGQNEGIIYNSLGQYMMFYLE